MKRIIICFIWFFAVCSYGQTIDEPYGFPVRPGTKEWSGLKTEKERFDAMQIPQDVLTKLSTSALAISCINFPAFSFFAIYNTYQEGFTILETKFNGLKEFVKRTDAGECLMKVYEKTDENGMLNQQSGVDTKYWSIRLSWIELMLAQREIYEPLNTDQKRHLLMLSFGKFKMQQVNNKEISSGDVLTTVLLMGRLLHSLNYNELESEYNQNVNLRNFLNKSLILDNQTIDLIFKYSEDYLNN